MSLLRPRRPRVAAVLAVTAVAAVGASLSVWYTASAATLTPGATYTLVNQNSGLALTVANGSTANGAAVVQAPDTRAAHQRWTVMRVSGDNYKLVNQASGRALDVFEHSTVDGAGIIQYNDTGGPNQQWRLLSAGNGYYTILGTQSGKALEVFGQEKANGARVNIWPDNGGTNQRWMLNPVTGSGNGNGNGTGSGTPKPPPATTAPANEPLPPSGGGNANGKQAERLGRGVISVRSGNGNLVSWRFLGTDPDNVAFNVYRGGTKVNGSPITNSTNYLDSNAGAGQQYTVRPVVNGSEQAASSPALQFRNGYLDVPIQSPGSGYAANDASVGDLDGDGEYEIVLKWDPTNAKDNSQAGVTGNVYIDGYRLNGSRMWRIDLGRNIRAGAHYTQFQVYDYDGDGRAEVAMKTADGTRDGAGKVIGNASALHRSSSGYVLSGPEFLTVFDGRTGAARSTVNYDPPRGSVSGWGDSYGNRVDRFLAGTAYLDGKRPSIIMARGYYTRTVVAAWDFRDGRLTKRWTFDSNSAGSQYTGQGNHQLSIADADGDGRDEIMYGSIGIDDNGRPLWNNRTGHGDAYHVGDFVPSRPGLEIFKPSEHADSVAHWMGDARTGKLLWSAPSCRCDNGRGVAADIYAGNPGAEAWSATVGGLISAANGRQVSARKPGSMNFLAWWDGDPVRELLNGTQINKYGTGGDARLLTAPGVASINGTKATPNLSGDLFGDWREEVIWRTADNRALRIFSTPNPTNTRITTLMHDIQYREAIAWQNTAYNQPPHPSFFIGNGMASAPRPKIYTP